MIADLLEMQRPGGPWVLCALVGKGDFPGQQFDDAEKASAWAVKQNRAKRNVYFVPNEVRPGVNKKPSRAEIARVDWIFVDIDPAPKSDWGEEHERIKKLVTEGLAQKGIPTPTLVIDSGGGWQLGFKLRTPIDVTADPAKGEEVERIAKAMIALLDGDKSCFSIDHVYRLPGTTNYASPEKLKKQSGRPAEREAEVWSWTREPDGSLRTYTLDDFGQVVASTSSAVNKKPPSGTKAQRPSLHLGDGSGLDVAGLTAWATANGKTIKESTLALIATGADPIDPTRYTSRSEPLFRVCCDLVRAEVPDDMILGVITGPNEIAASVRDKPDWKGYALRQIERAHENAVDPWLLKLNDQHAVITSGKVRIAGWRRTHPELDREALDLQSFDDFRNRYRNQKVVVGFAENGQPIQKAVGSWWIDHPQRREFDNVIFIPGKAEEINGFLNLWRGWGVAPAPGGDWSLMREHIHFLCGGSDYGLKWLADAVQRPDRPAGVALILRGKEGTGKGVFGRAAKELFGRHGLQVTNAKHVTGNFNLHLRDCCLLFADEVTTHGDKTAEAVMKTLITEDTLVIEGKGADVVTAPNYAHIIMASNERWIVPAGANARRFAIFDVPDDHMEDYAYFAAIEKQLYAKSPNGTLIPGAGLAAMLYDLMNMDLGDWRPSHNLPKNMALSEQKARSLPGLSAYVFDMLLTGNLPPNTEESGGVPWVATSDLRAAADNWLKPRKGDNHFADNDIQILLAKRLKARKKRRGGRNGYFLDLQRMRAEWDTCPDLFTWGEWPDDSEDDPDPKPPF